MMGDNDLRDAIGLLLRLWEKGGQEACEALLRFLKTAEALDLLVSYLEADPDLFLGDDDGALRGLVDQAHDALKKTKGGA
jgi:hypothetical protein